jgi:GrpB-like predicted nucleotidyltransferase (UPF0157 family)
MVEAPVEIVPYDVSWPVRFEEERNRLQQTIAPWLAGPTGYCYAPYRSESEHWFCKPSPGFRTHHLHVVPVASPQWLETLAFRDYLRSHPAVAFEYGNLKRRLAQEFRSDREGYTQAKGPFMTRITELALALG